MRKQLLFCAVLFMSAELYAQQVEVSHDPIPSLQTNQSLKELAPDTIFQAKNGIQDSLGVLKELSNIQRVYSEKQWKSFSDSLHKLPFANLPELPEPPIKKEISEEELVQAVNQEFFSGAKDSVSDGMDSLQGIANKDRYTVPSSDDLYSKADLSQLKLAQYEKISLPPLSGNFIKSSYIKELDSIRKINLKEEKLKLEEKKLSEQGKLSVFQKKPSFLDRSYFEGVLGISGGDFTILQASPALGYHFTDYLSLGLGPNILIREEDKKVSSTVGIRSFIKAEFMKRQAYIQVEDIMDSYGGNRKAEKKPIFEQHNVFVGGGYLLSLSSPLTLNLSVLYRVSDDKFITNEFSPWVFRIGISTIKIKK